MLKRSPILTAAAVLASLALPAAADAHRHRSPALSISVARAQIVRRFGPGTEVTRCRQFARDLVGCDYSTPSGNESIETEDPGSRWYSFATVTRVKGRLIVRTTT